MALLVLAAAVVVALAWWRSGLAGRRVLMLSYGVRAEVCPERKEGLM